MKKHFVLLLALMLCITLLSGCGANDEIVCHTYQDLSISIPTDFLDLSAEGFAADYEFLHAREPITVSGLRDEKAVIAAYGLQWTLEDYSKFLLLSNGVVSAVEQKDGLNTFTYESGGYTYAVTLWETKDAFWTVQAYCPTEDFPKAETDMWKILSSVTA